MNVTRLATLSIVNNSFLSLFFLTALLVNYSFLDSGDCFIFDFLSYTRGNPKSSPAQVLPKGLLSLKTILPFFFYTKLDETHNFHTKPSSN